MHDSLIALLFITIVMVSFVLLQPFIPMIMKQWRPNEEKAKYNAVIIYIAYIPPSDQTNLHIGVLNNGDQPFTIKYLIGNTPISKITINQVVQPHQVVDIRINGIILPPAYLVLDDGTYVELDLPNPPQYQTVSVG